MLDEAKREPRSFWLRLNVKLKRKIEHRPTQTVKRIRALLLMKLAMQVVIRVCAAKTPGEHRERAARPNDHDRALAKLVREIA